MQVGKALGRPNADVENQHLKKGPVMIILAGSPEKRAVQLWWLDENGNEQNQNSVITARLVEDLARVVIGHAQCYDAKEIQITIKLQPEEG